MCYMYISGLNAYPGYSAPDDGRGGGDSGLSGGAIFGIILAVFVAIAGVVALVLYLSPTARLRTQQAWITVSSK